VKSTPASRDSSPASPDKLDDELRKAIASRAYADNGYPFDVL
jgi:hypothetical protein